jgi:hypothetical protein
MFDKSHFVVSEIYNPKGQMERFLHLKRLMDQKCAANLRLLATKNNINRASDYHYLNLAVTQSTEPVNGIDYIHPVVKPNVDYSTAVISKGLMQNGEINFEFVPDNEDDATAAQQATNMVHKLVNQNNDPHFILQHWIMDALLHKNGEMMISPNRELITRYVKTKGTADQLQAFEAQAADSGLTVLRTSKRKTSVNLEQVMKETQDWHAGATEERKQIIKDNILQRLKLASEGDDEALSANLLTPEEDIPNADADSELQSAINRNTVYDAEYKLTGYNLSIKFTPIAQHYWMCNPTIINIQDQDFCGYYDPMSIQEAYEKYPDMNLEKFMEFAEYSNVGAYQAGSLLNNLAIHARDSVPINGLPSTGYAAQDPTARQVTVLTTWNHYDIDNDGELELVEIIYSGSYIISAREVEFIPVANMCPRPLPQNFYGMSLAESLVPAQEYMTSAHRAEIQLGLLTATSRIGVKPDRVDFEMIQDGEAAIFILDSKFDPATDIYPMPPPAGNLSFIEVAMTRMQQDIMGLVGMTTPVDTFTPEVMSPGNSGAKLQLAMGPNQLIQDNIIKNCAQGLEDALWLVWRTLVQYSDDYGVKKLAAQFHPDKEPVFLDGQSYDNMDFCERKIIHIDLAVGMASEENALQRIQAIKAAQTALTQEVAQAVQMNAITPESFKKMRRPYEDMMYVLGVKEANTYLLTEEEVMAMVKQVQEAASQKQPSPDDLKTKAETELDQAKTQEIIAKISGQHPELANQMAKINSQTAKDQAMANKTNADVAGTSADRQLEAIALMTQHKATNY